MLFEFTNEKGEVRELPEWDVVNIALSAKQKKRSQFINLIESWMNNPSKGKFLFFPEGRMLTRL